MLKRLASDEPENPYSRKGSVFIDLLVRIARFVKQKIVSILRQLFGTSSYMEVNCTDLSPSVRIPCSSLAIFPLVSDVEIKFCTVGRQLVSADSRPWHHRFS
jgi:hypothetical protein